MPGKQLVRFPTTSLPGQRSIWSMPSSSAAWTDWPQDSIHLLDAAVQKLPPRAAHGQFSNPNVSLANLHHSLTNWVELAVILPAVASDLPPTLGGRPVKFAGNEGLDPKHSFNLGGSVHNQWHTEWVYWDSARTLADRSPCVTCFVDEFIRSKRVHDGCSQNKAQIPNK